MSAVSQRKNAFDAAYADPDQAIEDNYNDQKGTLDGWGAQMVAAWSIGNAYQAGQMFGKFAEGLLRLPSSDG